MTQRLRLATQDKKSYPERCTNSGKIYAYVWSFENCDIAADHLALFRRAGWLKNTIKVELARSAHPGGINKRTYSFYLTHLFSLLFLFIEISLSSFCYKENPPLCSPCLASITHSRVCWSAFSLLLIIKSSFLIYSLCFFPSSALSVSTWDILSRCLASRLSLAFWKWACSFSSAGVSR